jgi:AraC-like DNA-binding protein
VFEAERFTRRHRCLRWQVTAVPWSAVDDGQVAFVMPLALAPASARGGLSVHLVRSTRPSTFRQHFRTLTGVSPLQYQKQLRLQEARQLMLNENLDAGSAGGRVGYESASQFSREYSRLFGAPPQRDITRMRLAPVAAAGTRRPVARSTAHKTGPRHRSNRQSLVSR